MATMLDNSTLTMKLTITVIYKIMDISEQSCRSCPRLYGMFDFCGDYAMRLIHQLKNLFIVGLREK